MVLQLAMKRLTFFLFTTIVTCCEIFSQSKGNFHTSIYTTENGLPSNGIKGLEWDESSGFLWIATEAGISRFNGLDFSNFTFGNTPFIKSERMLFIVKNNKGKIYAADQSGTLFTINNNRLFLYQKVGNVPQYDLNKMFTISISDTFFKDRTFYKASQPFNLLYTSNLATSDTSAFIIYQSKVYSLRMGMNDAVLYPDSNVAALAGFKLDKRCFFFSKRRIIYELHDDPALNKAVPIVDEEGNNLNFLEKSGRIYWVNGMENPVLINQNKAWVLSWSENKIIATEICDEIPTGALIEYVQYSQKKKLLFIGTDSKGIIVISKNRVTAMKNLAPDFNQRNAYYSQIELKNGNVLTNEGHIIGNSQSMADVPIKGKFTYLTSVTKDSTLWYCQNDKEAGYVCLHSYDQKNRQTRVYKKIQGAEIVITELSNGKKLAVTEFGIAWFIGDSLQYIYRHPAVSYNTASYKAEEIEPGVVLLATCAGILKFDTNKKLVDTVFKSVGYCIRSTWRHKDYIFFGTYGKGFLIWKNGMLKSMPIDKGKYLLYTHCFVPDKDGFCWMSTNRGLFKAKIDELINAYEKDLPVVYYHYFGKNDGMDIMEMNGGCTPCALEMKNKTISFPTMDGLLWVDPEKANPILPDGEIYIDEIHADSIEHDPKKPGSFLLPVNTKDIDIKLAFAAWCNKENVYLEYQLNDTLNWQPINTDINAIVHISNLSPGEYTVRFRKLNGFGINNYSYKTIHFRIITPWYKMWWFTVLVVFAVGGLVLLYVNLRTRQLKNSQQRLEKQVSEKTKELQLKNEVLEKNDSIKTRLISIISHDIVTPLKFLTAAGKNLIEKRNVMSEELQKETLAEMANTSQELQMLSTNILNWIKYQTENRRLARENFNVHELVQQVMGILRSLARQKHLVLKNMVDPNLTMYQFYEPLKILVYNLLTNAINFSEKGEIQIGTERENEFIRIWVKDHGVGMTPEQIQHITADEIIITSANVDKRKGHGLGYLIIKDLLKMTGGTLQIESEKGKGSTISITLHANQKSNFQES